MTDLRAQLEDLAVEASLYGDLDSAIHTAVRRRRRNTVLALTAAAAVVAGLVTGGLSITRNESARLTPVAPQLTPAPKTLQSGAVTPGRYQFALQNACPHGKGCPVDQQPVLPSLQITVPEGWDADLDFQTLWPMPGRDNASRNDPGLAMGWTTSWVRLFSNPCHAADPPAAEIAVGPTVEDFVNAVTAHRSLDVTAPTPVTLGRHTGRFLTLHGPASTSGCGEWRPWDPAPYLQGASQTWDMWVMNVDGVRVVIMAEYFPETPTQIKTELREMAKSIRFVPRTT